MGESTGAFDAWGSALVSSVVGAVAVVIGVVFAQWLVDKRRQADDRKRSALQLIEQISNLRDEACSRSRGLNGDYALYPMRNSLFLTFGAIGTRPAYQEAKRFYATVQQWRDWVRRRQPRGTRATWRESDRGILQQYQDAISEHAEGVIALLQNDLESRTLDFVPPSRPQLPDVAERS